MRVLVTGATGYIGGRLVPRLLDAGHSVRVLVRDPARVRGRPWADDVEVVAGDILEPASLEGACRGMDAAYYLVHSMGGGSDFAERDRRAAEHFAAAAQGLDHVVYLGGLVPDGDDVSEHLASRAEVGRVLRRACRTTEFRAGPVIGSGSGSFEMLRYLTERLPVMVAPKWVLNEVQPVGVRDVLAYLVGALEVGPLGIVEIGCPDRLSFRDMMFVYADVRGLRRWIVPVPVLTPRLAGLWVGLVTPVPNRLAVPLIKGIIRPVVADTTLARKAFPDVEPMTYREAVELALRRMHEGRVETAWTGALGPGPVYELETREGLVSELRTVEVAAPAEDVYAAFSSLGGDHGWPAFDTLWRVRGLLDRLAGGPGLRRGRRHPTRLHVGDVVDFWRVERAEPPRLLRLRAEMRLPGRAWLEWRTEGLPGGRTRLVQTALFAPRGLWGHVYWWVNYPAHRLIFGRLASAIAGDAEARHADTPTRKSSRLVSPKE